MTFQKQCELFYKSVKLFHVEETFALTTFFTLVASIGFAGEFDCKYGVHFALVFEAIMSVVIVTLLITTIILDIVQNHYNEKSIFW